MNSDLELACGILSVHIWAAAVWVRPGMLPAFMLAVAVSALCGMFYRRLKGQA